MMNGKELWVGIGRQKITPEIPVGLAGYFNVRMWDHVLDDIEVRTMVFRSDGKYGAIVQYDLIGVSECLWHRLLEAINHAGISCLSADNMIVVATHSHTAPEVRSGRGGFNPDYIEFAAAKGCAALQAAISDLEPCTVEHGMTEEHRFAFNRRYWMKNGEVLTNPGKCNPGVIRPEGEIDPEIPLLAFRRGNRLKALIANITNHADTVGGTGVSADWPGFLIRTMEEKLPSPAMVMPLIGCSGNINHFDISAPEPQTSYAEAKRIGKGYAGKIEKALPVISPMRECGMQTYCRQISIPPRCLSGAEIAEAEEIIKKYPDVEVNRVGGPELTADDLARKTPFAQKFFAVSLLENAGNNRARKFELVRIDIGEAVIIAVPCEPFVETGLMLRKGFFAGKTAFVASLANGSGTGYIPNCWNYGRGGYETTPRSNPYSAETAELLLATWRETVNQERAQP